ncbi:MAG TPA: hypothetical protein VH643_17205 [Gemmataceae bacterium]
MTLLSDTSPEAEKVLESVFQQMPMGRKWQLIEETYTEGRAIHAIGVRLRNSSATLRDIHVDWLRARLDLSIPEPPAHTNFRPIPAPRNLVHLFHLFAQLDIPCVLGGSMASSIHGVVRFNCNADITAEPFPGKEAQLVAAFGEDHYISLPAVRQAVRQRSSFNIINTSTGFKADVFIRKDRPFEQSAMSRRLTVDLPDAPGEPLSLYTAEDVILFKLWWYRLGQESAHQQWADVQGVLKVQADKLDQAYLDHWAADLGVRDLLERARQESGV